MIRDASDGLVTSAADADKMFEVEFADGRVAVAGGPSPVAPATAKSEKPTAKPRTKKPKPAGPDQGSLF